MLNSVIAGAVTGGVISFRGGWKAISRGALVGGVFLALIESILQFFVQLLIFI